MSLTSALAPLQARWTQLAARERTLLALAATVVLGATLWWLVLAPMAATLRTADTRARALDAQLQQMLALQAQVQNLQAQPPLRTTIQLYRNSRTPCRFTSSLTFRQTRSSRCTT